MALTLAFIIGPAGLDCGRRNHGQALLRTAVDLLLHPLVWSCLVSSGLPPDLPLPTRFRQPAEVGDHGTQNDDTELAEGTLRYSWYDCLGA